MIEQYRIVIPARMASQRLPGKPLAVLAGRSLLEHVHLRAQASSASIVVVATDDAKIQQVAERFDAQVIMTSSAHQSGSDRIAEAVSKLGWPDETIVVNLQGDEPLMPAACLDQVAQLLREDPDADMASLYWPIEAEEDARDPNIVKVVFSQSGNALYFSRSLLPYPRGYDRLADAMNKGADFWRHVGLYAYRVGALKRFAQMKPTPLEKAEKLEQLRVLEYGGRIAMAQACEFIPAGVDTAEDLQRVEKTLINYINKDQ